jgi:dTDP-glucose pyrophosphorylase/CBS domain-containing protein
VKPLAPMTRIDRLTVRSDATIREAMTAIEAGAAEVCLVITAEGRLTGLVTDGDVRRALLAGRTMESSVGECLNPQFHAVTQEAGRAEVLDLMLARGFTQVPIVDGDGRLAGLHLLRELIGSQVRPNHAVIMAGGQGVRLRPLTEHVPKPMIPIAGRPILERLILHLISFGIRHIHLAINYKGDMIERHFGNGGRFGCRIDYLRESVPLGTVGAITLLNEPPQHPLLVMNGDLVTQVNIERLLKVHEAGTASVTVGVREHRITLPYGVIDAGPDGRVAALREKPTEVFLINAGVYVVSPACWAGLERGAEAAMPDLLARCIEADDPPALFVIEEDWVDVGRHEDLQRARGHFAS